MPTNGVISKSIRLNFWKHLQF